ncbi:MAG: FGGY-family carbohydrate kinase [Marmoricola sp.]
MGEVRSPAVLGVDIGTSSSKGVLVGFDGTILAAATRHHTVSRPRPGHVEMDAELWWQEFVDICAELVTGDQDVVTVGVSGMGPCLLLTDADDVPLRPAILYGVDTRATDQIRVLTDELGGDAVIMARCGSTLSTQAVGPKLRWVAEEEPEVFARARRMFMPSSWLVRRLTGSYLLDHHSASQCTPLYDAVALDWYAPWCRSVVGDLELPELTWPGAVGGHVTPAAAALTGLAPGTPVVAGTIDAWSEAVSVGAQHPGDLMLMYGTTMFLIGTVAERITAPALWGTVGAFEGTRNLAGGMATSGAITGWLRDLFTGSDYADLVALAAESGPGARGLLMLPYFAGERTPIQDPHARGVLAGLTVTHTRGDLYRAALEATAFGVRHNIEEMERAGARIERVVAVGGGTASNVWAQIVSDVTGRSQELRRHTIGASYGAAFLAAGVCADVSIDDWNPVVEVLDPDRSLAADYDELYRLYRDLYPATRSISHRLAERQRTQPPQSTRTEETNYEHLRIP